MEIIIVAYSIIAISVLSYGFITLRRLSKKIKLNEIEMKKNDQELKIINKYIELIDKRAEILKSIEEYADKTNELRETFQLYDSLGLEYEAQDYYNILVERIQTFEIMLNDFKARKQFEDDHKFLLGV